MATAVPMSAQQSAQQAATQNMSVRQFLLANAVPMFQNIFTSNVVPANGNVVNVPIQNVGLIRGFLVVISGTLRNTDAALVQTRSQLGAANLVSNFTFTDLNNVVRINTPGWHMALINSAKQPAVFMGAYAPNIPMNFGSNWAVNAGPATVAAVTDAAVKFMYYVPLAYSANDLRGAMYAGVVNATSQLQITLNPTPMVAAAADATNAVYGGSVIATGGGWKAATPVTVTVYQDYLDQIPIVNGQPLLPALDTSVVYELKQVAMSGLVQNQDYGIPFANFRTFLSSTVIVNNNGVLAAGTDINYWALRAANTTSLFQYTPDIAALNARNIFLADPPNGVYHFSHRNRPINTQQFGNVNLVINPNANMNANASLLIGFEDFAQLDQVSFAASLPSGI